MCCFVLVSNTLVIAKGPPWTWSYYIGVMKVNGGKWQAKIKVNNAQQLIGVFDTEIEAAKAYDEKARAFPDRKLNFPDKKVNAEEEEEDDEGEDDDNEDDEQYNQRSSSSGNSRGMEIVSFVYCIYCGFYILLFSSPFVGRSRGWSKYTGVSRLPSGKWATRIGINGGSEYVGYFHTEIEAAKAYDERARTLPGCKKLNFADDMKTRRQGKEEEEEEEEDGHEEQYYVSTKKQRKL